MKSASQLLLYRTYVEVWFRGDNYANLGKVKIVKYDEKFIDAIVNGSKKYKVRLEFRGGGISKKCNCPYIESHSDKIICKHMVAVSIIWDEIRGIERPNKEEIERTSTTPSEVSVADIDNLYEDPLNADLELLRILADETAFGGRPRPHARLPQIPKFNLKTEEPLTMKEVKQAFKDIGKWSKLRNYDPYFCSGEMVAAFCEIMRIIITRLRNTFPIIAVEILLEAQKFHYELIMELIDDSNGLHEFTEAHLDELCQILNRMPISSKDERKKIDQKLQEFNEHSNDY